MARTALVVGLGNPDAEYAYTRHNAGFVVLDCLAKRHGIQFRVNARFRAELAAVMCAGCKIIYVKPMTYMNRSGEAVGALARYYNVADVDVLVIHDDLDLPPGRLKFVAGGGDGGHRGIRSIVEHSGGKTFSRLKIGIGHPRDQEQTLAMAVENYVLAPLPSEDLERLYGLCPLVDEGITSLLTRGLPAAMNLMNRRDAG